MNSLRFFSLPIVTFFFFNKRDRKIFLLERKKTVEGNYADCFIDACSCGSISYRRRIAVFTDFVIFHGGGFVALFGYGAVSTDSRTVPRK
jgi:hypothetical protein